MHVPRTGGIWLIAVCGIIVQKCRRLPGTRQSRFLLLSAALITCAYLTIFLFSTRPLYWHLKAVERIMLTPALILLLFCFRQLFIRLHFDFFHGHNNSAEKTRDNIIRQNY